MRALVQRVAKAEVTSEGESLGRIGSGLLVFLAVGTEDGPSDLSWMKRKVINLRIFADDEGRMNRSVVQSGGEILVVSQFTLYGDCRKGNRPGFSRSAPPEQARNLYERFLDELRVEGIDVQAGRFQASMQVHLINDGPVTLILDSRQAD